MLHRDEFERHLGYYRHASGAIYHAHERIQRARLEVEMRWNLVSRLTQLEDLITHTITSTQEDKILEINILDTDIRALEQWVRR
jgi:hypothetical protein